MKSMVLAGLNRIEIADRPIPELKNPDDLLIRMRSVGVCGSDIHYYSTGNIGSQVVQFPFTLGHEGAGVIEKTGNAVKTLKPGGRLNADRMQTHNFSLDDADKAFELVAGYREGVMKAMIHI